MIDLYSFPPAFGVPCSGPFALKTEVHLKMMDLPYTKRYEGIGTAPKGKIPYIVDAGRVVADSTFIRLYLEDRYEIDLDSGYDDDERAQAWIVEKFVEEQLYWAMVYMRWAIDENFGKGPSHFFDDLPEGVQDAARQGQRKAVLGNLHGHGLGRHDLGEIKQLAEIGFAALARTLGTKRHLLGERPCGADASLFAQLACVLTPFFDSPVRDAAVRHDNLIDYTDRMMAAYFPDESGVGAPKSASDEGKGSR